MSKYVKFWYKIKILDKDTGKVLDEGIFKDISDCFFYRKMYECWFSTETDYDIKSLDFDVDDNINK